MEALRGCRNPHLWSKAAGQSTRETQPRPGHPWLPSLPGCPSRSGASQRAGSYKAGQSTFEMKQLCCLLARKKGGVKERKLERGDTTVNMVSICVSPPVMRQIKRRLTALRRIAIVPGAASRRRALTHRQVFITPRHQASSLRCLSMPSWPLLNAADKIRKSGQTIYSNPSLSFLELYAAQSGRE